MPQVFGKLIYEWHKLNYMTNCVNTKCVKFSFIYDLD